MLSLIYGLLCVVSRFSTSLLSSPALFSSKIFRLHKFVDKPTRNTIPFKSELRNGNRVARHSAASNENVKYFNFTPSLDGRWSKFTKYPIKLANFTPNTPLHLQLHRGTQKSSILLASHKKTKKQNKTKKQGQLGEENFHASFKYKPLSVQFVDHISIIIIPQSSALFFIIYTWFIFCPSPLLCAIFSNPHNRMTTVSVR